ncbi:hypothetical protein AC578_5685 [Pseudocercospora eumusae]|uniref:Uncharacterized protein n=1 Tax=Pseudocercospora eumusae TaxID=321146 RepID=A0A139H394_9PEZI|nr:hypothetical protein AC578_5685 [Pseudocercospora eumusae]
MIGKHDQKFPDTMDIWQNDSSEVHCYAEISDALSKFKRMGRTPELELATRLKCDNTTTGEAEVVLPIGLRRFINDAKLKEEIVRKHIRSLFAAQPPTKAGAQWGWAFGCFVSAIDRATYPIEALIYDQWPYSSAALIQCLHAGDIDVRLLENLTILKLNAFQAVKEVLACAGELKELHLRFAKAITWETESNVPALLFNLFSENSIQSLHLTGIGMMQLGVLEAFTKTWKSTLRELVVEEVGTFGFGGCVHTIRGLVDNLSLEEVSFLNVWAEHEGYTIPMPFDEHFEDRGGAEAVREKWRTLSLHVGG